MSGARTSRKVAFEEAESSKRTVGAAGANADVARRGRAFAARSAKRDSRARRPDSARSRFSMIGAQLISPRGLMTRNSDAAIPCSFECASAPRTSNPLSAKTPATLLNVPGRSGLTTATRSGSARIATSPVAIISRTPASGNNRHITSCTSPPPKT